jgi:ribosome assembly protein YihI (activator of Der GTPase)
MRTEEQRLAYNAYMRQYRKTPEQKEKTNARRKAQRVADPDKYKAIARRSARRRRWANPASVRAAHVKHNNGIAPEEYDARLASQNNICALCNEPFDGTMSGRPVLDHNHETEELREFIHCRCNLGIGNFLDSPAICRLAAAYLERH